MNDSPRPIESTPPTAIRWRIAGLLALATALSYLDRQSFPLLSKTVGEQIPFTDAQFGKMGAGFLIAYAAMYLVGGRLLDLIGTRAGYTLMICWWSLANLLTGLVQTVTGLGLARILLGIGEGGGFPASGKAVAEWFPPRERSLAFGLFNTGSAIGSVVAAPLLALIAVRFGWRTAFLATGAMGLVLGVIWWMRYSLPETNPRVSAEELAWIRQRHLPSKDESRESGLLPFRKLFSYRQTWGLIIAKMLTDSVWFFLITWIPRYLADVRHFDLKAIGSVAWIPYACAGAGSLLGGALGTWLIRRGLSLDHSRKLCLTLAAGMLPVTLGIGSVSTSWAVALMGIALFGHQFWSTNVQTLAADMFPRAVVGSVEGIIGCAGAATAGAVQYYLGDLIELHGYRIPFIATGILHLVSLAVLLLLVRRVEPVEVGVVSEVSDGGLRTTS